MSATLDAEYLNRMGKTYLPELLGITVTDVGPGTLDAELTVQHSHLAPNGYLHAGSVVALADATPDLKQRPRPLLRDPAD